MLIDLYTKDKLYAFTVMAEEHPPSPTLKGIPISLGRLTTSNLRFAGQARNDVKALVFLYSAKIWFFF